MGDGAGCAAGCAGHEVADRTLVIA